MDFQGKTFLLDFNEFYDIEVILVPKRKQEKDKGEKREQDCTTPETRNNVVEKKNKPENLGFVFAAPNSTFNIDFSFNFNQFNSVEYDYGNEVFGSGASIFESNEDVKTTGTFSGFETGVKTTGAFSNEGFDASGFKNATFSGGFGDFSGHFQDSTPDSTSRRLPFRGARRSRKIEQELPKTTPLSDSFTGFIDLVEQETSGFDFIDLVEQETPSVDLGFTGFGTYDDPIVYENEYEYTRDPIYGDLPIIKNRFVYVGQFGVYRGLIHHWVDRSPFKTSGYRVNSVHRYA